MIVQPDTMLVVTEENWHEVIQFYMPTAASVAFYFAKNRGYHVDEAIAEAYYVLTLKILWKIKHQPEIHEDMQRMVVSWIRRRLGDYFRYRKVDNIEDLLGANWQRVYSHLIAVPPIDESIESLMNSLVENDRELAVLILKTEGYNNKDISEHLNMELSHTNKIVAKIRGRFSVQRYDYLME